MPHEEQKLDVDTIVEKAFEYFDRFVDRKNQLDGVLLEELEPQDDGWVVTIGFDGWRHETTEPTAGVGMAALAGFASKTTKTVREVRRIHLDNEGRFLRIS